MHIRVFLRLIKKKRKATQAAKKLLTSIKEKGPLGKKSPFTRKKKQSVRIRRVAGSHHLTLEGLKPADLS